MPRNERKQVAEKEQNKRKKGGEVKKKGDKEDQKITIDRKEKANKGEDVSEWCCS